MPEPLVIHDIVIEPSGTQDDYPGVAIRPPGTGDCNTLDGEGFPIVVEHGKVYIWADINQEDPTHIIDLSGAMESARTIEDD